MTNTAYLFSLQTNCILCKHIYYKIYKHLSPTTHVMFNTSYAIKYNYLNCENIERDVTSHFTVNVSNKFLIILCECSKIKYPYMFIGLPRMHIGVISSLVHVFKLGVGLIINTRHPSYHQH